MSVADVFIISLLLIILQENVSKLDSVAMEIIKEKTHHNEDIYFLFGFHCGVTRLVGPLTPAL